jgi:hypothetical protein
MGDGQEQAGQQPRYEFSHGLIRTWARPPRDPARIDRVAAKLLELWKLEPDQRLGQLVVNVARSEGRRLELPDVQLLEDDEFERLLDDQLASAQERHEASDAGRDGHGGESTGSMTEEHEQ